MGKMRSEYKTLVGKPEGKRPCIRHRQRWEDNIRMDLKKLGWKGLAQDRDQWWTPMKTVMYLQIP
jgi:hypothetical protein